MDDERERLAADILAAERVIQWNAERNRSHAAAAKRWLAELEAEALRLHRVERPQVPRRGPAGEADVERLQLLEPAT